MRQSSVREQAFCDYREQTRGLEGLAAETQVGVLRHKLFAALERAHQWQRRTEELDAAVGRLELDQRSRACEHQEFAAWASRELAGARAICRGLMRTIQAAVDSSLTPERPIDARSASVVLNGGADSQSPA